MLQQTQVSRVAPKFESFMARYADIGALAAASPADVIQAWSGLGYNRRAVNLHRLARAVAEKHGGCCPRMPRHYESCPASARTQRGL